MSEVLPTTFLIFGFHRRDSGLEGSFVEYKGPLWNIKLDQGASEYTAELHRGRNQRSEYRALKKAVMFNLRHIRYHGLTSLVSFDPLSKKTCPLCRPTQHPDQFGGIAC